VIPPTARRLIIALIHATLALGIVTLVVLFFLFIGFRLLIVWLAPILDPGSS
jgi:hypothetical protein